MVAIDYLGFYYFERTRPPVPPHSLYGGWGVSGALFTTRLSGQLMKQSRRSSREVIVQMQTHLRLFIPFLLLHLAHSLLVFIVHKSWRLQIKSSFQSDLLFCRTTVFCKLSILPHHLHIQPPPLVLPLFPKVFSIVHGHSYFSAEVKFT